MIATFLAIADIQIPLLFSELGWVVIVVIAVMLIFTGKLRTEREIHEHERATNLWQKAYENERDARHNNLDAVNETLQVTQVILSIVSAWDEFLDNEQTNRAIRDAHQRLNDSEDDEQ